MKYKIYQFLNQRVELFIFNDSIILNPFQKFLSSDSESDCVFTCETEENRTGCYGIQYLSGAGRRIKNIFFSQKDKSQMIYTFEDDYSHFIFQIDDDCILEIFLELLMVGFYSYMSLKNTLLMHASAVEHEDKSIAFTASSGVGKTTQAELWAKYKNATILNGDKVFLKSEDDGIHAWGSPWKGSSPYAENASAPLRAIVALEQAEENSIRKLEGFEVLEYVIPHVFFPGWDERCEQAVLTFLDQVLGETEVYLLKCRPDEEAVELLASTIKE